jgi:Cation transporter/ATPase, N-terminus
MESRDEPTRPNGTPKVMSDRDLGAYWSNAPDDLAAALHTSLRGLSSVEAATRLSRYGPNALDALRPLSRVGVLMKQRAGPTARTTDLVTERPAV